MSRFSLVYVLNDADAAVDMLSEKRSAKATPARIIPAAVKRTLDVPENLSVRTGRLDELETRLSKH